MPDLSELFVINHVHLIAFKVDLFGDNNELYSVKHEKHFIDYQLCKRFVLSWDFVLSTPHMDQCLRL